jgi:ribosome-binding factor A
MDSIRLNRIRSMMKDEISVIINRTLKDPRVPIVTVTDVLMTKDAKQATVMISVLPISGSLSDPEITKIALDALNHAKGYLKSELGGIMGLRMMPDLLFKEDKGLENTLRVNELLNQLAKEKKPDGESA